MPNRIIEDHKDFMDVYSGRIRKELQRFIKNDFLRKRTKNGMINITVPRLDIPHLVYGDNGSGVGKGPGKPGDVLKPGNKGKGKGQAGEEHSDGVTISVDLEYILKFLQNELELPDLQPKPSKVMENVEIKYNDISKVGPESLRHNRRTMMETIKRLAASNKLDELHEVPGFAQPIKLITPINSDRRYRQYKEIKKEANNAVIFFARDGSGSMDETKCDIVSDVCWWLDVWVRRFYSRVERCYIWHDTEAQEMDEKTFYNYRYGGGTICSSALNLISKQFENRFPPNNWNIYVFYFTDGDNMDNDNKVFIDKIKKHMPKSEVNFVGITQIGRSWNGADSGLKKYVDDNLKNLDSHNVKTTSILYDNEEQRNEMTKKALVDLIGKMNVNS